MPWHVGMAGGIRPDTTPVSDDESDGLNMPSAAKLSGTGAPLLSSAPIFIV